MLLAPRLRRKSFLTLELVPEVILIIPEDVEGKAGMSRASSAKLMQ